MLVEFKHDWRRVAGILHIPIRPHAYSIVLSLTDTFFMYDPSCPAMEQSTPEKKQKLNDNFPHEGPLISQILKLNPNC